MSHSKSFEAADSAALAPRKVDWRRAFRAIQLMRADPNRTDQVFELNVALDNGDSERQFQVFLAEPGGPALLEERPSLLERLADFDALRALPPDSLGANYLRVMEAAGFDADGLRREAAKVTEFAELHPGQERAWLAERGSCVHDLLHVVTGRSGPGYIDVITPGAFMDRDEERRLIALMDARAPALVIWPDHDFDWMPSRSIRVTAPLLSAWVREHYRPQPGTRSTILVPRS